MNLQCMSDKYCTLNIIQRLCKTITSVVVMTLVVLSVSNLSNNSSKAKFFADTRDSKLEQGTQCTL